VSDFSTLANQIFPSRPAEEGGFENRYVQSYGYYRFRLAMPEFAGLLASRYSESDLSREVANSERLGPYERQVLGQLLHAECCLVLIVGSAGSGKSSTLRYVLGFLDRHQLKPATEQTLGPFMRTLQLAEFKHVFVDLNGVVEKMRYAAARHAPEDAEDKLLLEIPPAIQSAILESLTPSAAAKGQRATELLMDVVKLVADWCLEPPHCPPAFKLQVPRVLAVLPKLDHAHTSGDFMRLASALTNLNGRTQLEFWFSILQALTILVRRPQGQGLVLIDNVDPLSEHLQLFLKSTLLDLVQNTSFKVILPVRVSTFWHGSTDYARPLAWYPHSGPGPLDVITTRILNFIANPERYSAYLALTEADRLKAAFRAFELLLRLHRGRGHYRALGRVLAAAAGDSIRRSMFMMEHLMTTAELRASYESVAEVADRLGDIRKRYEVRLLLERLGTAILEELTAIAQELPRTLVGQEEARWRHATVARLACTVTAVLENAAHEPGGRLLGEVEAEDLRSVCTKELAGRVCRGQVQVGWELVERSFRDRGIAQEAIATTREALVQKLGPAIADPLQETLGGPKVRGTEVWDLVREGIRSGGTGSGLRVFEPSGDDEDDVLKSNFDTWDDCQLCRRVLLENGPHVAVRSLVRSRFVSDMFHDSSQERHVSSGKARLLFLVAGQRDHCIELSRVLDYLAACGFTKPSVLSFVNDLLSESARAIWINKSFAYRDYQELERDRSRTVRLTRGGWGLLTVVAGELNYLTSIFQPATRGTKVAGRLMHALDELQAVQNKDLTILQNWIRESPGIEIVNPPHAVLNGTALQVAARVTNELIWYCRGHFRRVLKYEQRVDERLSELETTRETLRRWYRFLKDESRQVCTVAPPPKDGERPSSSMPAFWVNRALDPAHPLAAPPRGMGHVVEMANLLEGSLRSDDVWCVDLPRDEFRAN
jgi:hypothetical protein